FSPASDVGRVNGAAPGAPVAVSAATALVVAAALRWAERTEGAFDPALGRASELWDAHGRSAPPSADETRPFAGRRLHRALGLDRWRGGDVVVRADARVALDLGGIAKGYAVDRAVTILREWGIESALVNVGGDLYALGRSPEGDPWQVGVRSPERPDALATTLRVADRAVATSGDYARFFEHGGRRWHHLLDPATGQPRRSARHSITVAAGSCMEADAAGTAAFGLEATAAQRLVHTAAPDAEVLHVV
ncbi:MAG TPA: FAD:protein FMN transferase, partial [Longimicrobiales bacterium]|nr:FAD:protein FMN transferase [Longimicrobiales bacterium]